MSNIFSDHAPRYWAAGLPVIPLWPRTKRPAVLEWSQFAYRMPAEEERELWLRQHPNGNVGLPLGPCSGLVAFDVDTKDQGLIEVIEGLMPGKSPWRRVGAKGYVAVFKFQGEKTGRIKDQEGHTICEILSAGAQVVLPPSIHPDTNLPYSANQDLLEVVGGVPTLPRDFERTLRAALGHKGVKLSISGSSRVTEFVPKSSRDTAYTRICGMYARDVVTGKMPMLEAIQAVQEWPHTFTEQVDGDNLDPQEGVRKLTHFLLRSVREHDMVLRTGWDRGLSEEDKTSLGLEFTSDEQEWTFDALVSNLREDLDAAQTSSTRMGVIDQTVRRLARSPGMSGLHHDALLRAIVHESSVKGLRTTVATLRKEIQKIKNRGLTGDSHAEIADYMREEIYQTAEVRFDAGRFWEWEGSQWIEKEEHVLEGFIVTNYGMLPTCKRDNDYKAVLKTFKTKVMKPLRSFDTEGVNFSNGFLTSEGKLVEHNPEYGTTYRLPYRFVPESAGKSPKFFKFLEDAWGEDEDVGDKIKFLQEALCATLLGIAPKMAKAILMYGIAHSGKSVLLRIVEGLLPSSLVSAIGPDVWGDRFAPAQLTGKMLNIGGELHERKKIDGKSFKEIISGETIEVQQKNKPLYKLKPQAAHWFASNYLPTSDDMSEGFLRRWGILHFSKAFPENKRNIHLADEIITEEREAIVAWAVQAMERVNATHAYTVPASHERLIGELLAAQDTIVNFIQASHRVLLTGIPSVTMAGKTGALKSTATPARLVLDGYQTFTASTGVRPVTPVRFFARMKELSGRMGFKVVIETSGNGFQEVGYVGLTMVDANGREKAT